MGAHQADDLGPVGEGFGVWDVDCYEVPGAVWAGLDEFGVRGPPGLAVRAGFVDRFRWGVCWRGEIVLVLGVGCGCCNAGVLEGDVEEVDGFVDGEEVVD